MQRAVNAVGTKDFGVIVARYSSSTFGFASRNFYAEFLAVREIVKTPYKYFPALEFDVPRMFRTLQVDAYMDIVALETYLGLDREEIMRWNPSLRRPVLYGQRRVPKGFLLHLPPGHLSRDDLQRRWAAIPSRLKFAHQIKIAKYRVQPGDTLSDIAARFETSLKILASFNDIGRPYTIRAGQVLEIPWLSGEPRHYRVQQGDSLSKIAHRFGTTVSALAKLNGLRQPYRLRTGQVIRLPFHSQAFRSPVERQRRQYAAYRHVSQVEYT
jgi:membrane-bound lytic murein transglycosylase D